MRALGKNSPLLSHQLNPLGRQVVVGLGLGEALMRLSLRLLRLEPVSQQLLLQLKSSLSLLHLSLLTKLLRLRNHIRWLEQRRDVQAGVRGRGLAFNRLKSRCTLLTQVVEKGKSALCHLSSSLDMGGSLDLSLHLSYLVLSSQLSKLLSPSESNHVAQIRRITGLGVPICVTDLICAAITSRKSSLLMSLLLQVPQAQGVWETKHPQESILERVVLNPLVVGEGQQLWILDEHLLAELARSSKILGLCVFVVDVGWLGVSAGVIVRVEPGKRLNWGIEDVQILLVLVVEPVLLVLGDWLGFVRLILRIWDFVVIISSGMNLL